MIGFLGLLLAILVEEAIEDLGICVCAFHLISHLLLAIFENWNCRCVNKVRLRRCCAFSEDQMCIGVRGTVHAALISGGCKRTTRAVVRHHRYLGAAYVASNFVTGYTSWNIVAPRNKAH